MSMERPFSQGCENNKQPILEILLMEFADRTAVLEIGSGTGQHAVYFAPAMPHLTWQPSDVGANLPGIIQWRETFPADNLLPPLELDVTQSPWPAITADAVFSANTAHIMPWHAVCDMFRGIGQLLPVNGAFCLYGPMSYNGEYTSDSNRQFDQWLKDQNPCQGIRDFHELNRLAIFAGLLLLEDIPMPANNHLLIWRKVFK